MKLISVLMVFLVMGCATMGNKSLENKDCADFIQKGVTTSGEVRKALGVPMWMFFTNNEEVWHYNLTKAHIRPASFIPIIGLFVGGSDMQSNSLTIKFDDKGIVKQFGWGETKGGMGSVFD